MRHDARSGGVSIGQFDESEVLGVEQASIESQLRQGGGDRCQSRCDDALGFSPSHLGVNDIVVHRIEPEQPGRKTPVERKR